MSIILGIGLLWLGACIGALIMSVFAMSGGDSQREEVRDALQKLDARLYWLSRETDDPNQSDTIGMCSVAVRGLADLLGYSRSIFDSWKTCDTANAPVASTGIGGTASDAAAVASPMNGIGVAGSGCPVKQSIASK